MMRKSAFIPAILLICTLLATSVVAKPRDELDLDPQSYIPIVAKTDLQHVALMALYYATEGPNWYYHGSWGSSSHYCDWERVYCNENGNVGRLYLEANNLSGELPPELVYLESLEELTVNNNNLSGSIIVISQLPKLRIARLHSNSFTGPIPPELGNLSNLEELSLSWNELTGNIPPQLGNLTYLDMLLLHDNDLSGSIPPELCNLTKLSALHIGNNNLIGSIPSELGSLTRLSYLGMGGNKFVGSIPPELGNLSELYGLELSDNSLSGPIPAALANMNSCHVLHLDNNPSLVCWETKSARDWAQNLPNYLGPTAVCTPR